MNRAERMEAALRAALPGSGTVEITDDSARHEGHAGARPEGETHYLLSMVSPAFAGLSRVERSRLVHSILQPEFARGLHALNLRLRAPGEAAATTGGPFTAA